MAVSKMKKMTLIADKRHHEKILQAVQAIQSVELRDLFQESSSNEWVTAYFNQVTPAEDSEDSKKNEQQIYEISEAIHFLNRNSDNKQKKQHLTRQVVSLSQLENQFDEAALTKYLTVIRKSRQKFEKLQDEQHTLNEIEEYLSHWQYLDSSPTDFHSDFVTLILATIETPEFEDIRHRLAAVGTLYLEEIYSDPKETKFAVILLKEDTEKVSQLVQSTGMTLEHYPYELKPQAKLAEVKEQLVANVTAFTTLTEQISHYCPWITELEWAEEVLLARKNREASKQKLIRSDYLTVLQGWLPENQVNTLKQSLFSELAPDDIHLTFEEPNEDEIAEEIPSKLENHPLVEPFEMLTEMYSLPKYREVDPTPWFMPFYLLFFGMMVADVGYGLLMVLITGVALKTRVFNRGITKFLRFFRILAVPTIVWGIIYSSFFGASLPFPALLSTTKDVITILILSVIFGFLQIMTGLFLAAREHIKRRDYVGAVSEGFSWQGILVGIALAVCGKILLHNQALFMIGVGIAVLCALTIIIIPMVTSRSKVQGFAKGAYSLYGLTSYIGDLVSYTRLMALGISGGSIAAAFNMLVGYMPVGARFTLGLVLLIALHALNIFLSLLGAYVHGARLQYVEFFGKFYTGGGRAFKPLKTNEKYLTIENKSTNGGKQ